tara:strand:- start:2243 stop:2884 length:642 start_codon:yes stop_codon:yes gene_type:complete
VHTKVDTYLENLDNWQAELKQLCSILISCGLTEAFKWRNPCYTFQDKNVLILFGFKEYCGVSFLKGVLLKDELNILVQPTENMQAVRQLRFTNVADILKLTDVIKTYVFEAIEVEKSAVKVPSKKVSEFDVPKELEIIFKEEKDFKEAFYALTPGRQKGYLLYFSAAKQPKTRISRIKKYQTRIFKGQGINDCVCGLSKKKPSCDGSHKQLEA